VKHALDHVAAGAGIYFAGEATTRRARAGWLAVATVAVVRAHRFHHHHRRG
jgi:hypothetical protein